MKYFILAALSFSQLIAFQAFASHHHSSEPACNHESLDEARNRAQ